MRLVSKWNFELIKGKLINHCMAADNGFNLTANGTAVFKGYAPISGWQWLDVGWPAMLAAGQPCQALRK